VTTTGTLPYTGADAAGLAVAGLAVVAGGLVLTAAARSRASASRR
jgi:LPXTG-motif cell wall-anchored protein